MKITFLTQYYPSFIASHYKKFPDLENATYSEQHQSLIKSRFGDSDFYSHWAKKFGWDASDIIVNSSTSQATWAKENNHKGLGSNRIWIEQLRARAPDVIYIHDFNLLRRDFLGEFKTKGTRIFGQIASRIPDNSDLGLLDGVFSSFPHYVKWFKRNGIPSWYVPLSFDVRLHSEVEIEGKDIPLSFIGGLTTYHGDFLSSLDTLCKLFNVEVYGYTDGVISNYPHIRSSYRGECWGLDMFKVLGRSLLTINRHHLTSWIYANNMRLFEGTGMGSCVITDEKENLNDLFRVGEDILGYTDMDDLKLQINRMLSRPELAIQIGCKARETVCNRHTYKQRVFMLLKIIESNLLTAKSGHWTDAIISKLQGE